MGVVITIATSKQAYFAGETVEGTVTVNVTNSHGTSADGLFLKLNGTISSLVIVGRYNRGQCKDILERHLQVATFGGHAEFGHRVFPFALVLPINLPVSMKETRPEGSWCSIEYYLYGTLTRPGFLNFDSTDKRGIKVFARPKLFRPLPVLARPHSTVVKTCRCFTSGCMTIGFLADRSVISRNEVLGVTVVARNDSMKPAKALVIMLCQQTTWTAEDWTRTNTRTIASIEISGSQLGDVMMPAERGNDRRRNLEVVSNATRNELEEILRSGAGVRHELVIPEDCLDTMDGDWIVVRHFIKAELKTDICANSPSLCISAVVQRVGGDVSGGATQPMSVATITPADPHARSRREPLGAPLPFAVVAECFQVWLPRTF